PSAHRASPPPLRRAVRDASRRDALLPSVAGILLDKHIGAPPGKLIPLRLLNADQCMNNSFLRTRERAANRYGLVTVPIGNLLDQLPDCVDYPHRVSRGHDTTRVMASCLPSQDTFFACNNRPACSTRLHKDTARRVMAAVTKPYHVGSRKK